MDVVDLRRNQNVRQGLVRVKLIKVRKDGSCLICGSSDIQGNLRILFFQDDYGVILEGEVAEEGNNFG